MVTREQETDQPSGMVRVVVKMPAKMVAEIDAVASRRDVGKRSQIVRESIRQFLDQRAQASQSA